MKIKNWKVYAIFIIVCEAVGLLSGLLSAQGMQVYADEILKPPLNPPAVLFPIVWTLLYGLMGISGARVWLSEPGEERERGLKLFAAQLIINFFWSLYFFNAQAFGFAFLWLLLLWILVLLMILSFAKTDRLAAWLQVPYLIWLTFAAYLNFAVWLINR